MKMKIVTVVVVCILSLLSLLIFGCGDERKTTTDGVENVSIMKKIKQRGKIVVGTEAAFAPFEFVEDGKIVGYGPDILQEIVKEMNVDLEQTDTPFASILTNLDNHKIDLVATSIVATPERQEKFALTTPLADLTQIVVVLENNNHINTIDDLDGTTFACVVGTIVEETLTNLDKELKAKGKKGIVIRTYQSNPETFLELKNGRIDAIVLDPIMGNELLKNEPNTYKIIGEIGEKSYFCWAVRKEDTDLLEFLNTKILELKRNGKLEELQKKWLGTTFTLPDELPSKWVKKSTKQIAW